MAIRNPLAAFATYNSLWRFGCASTGEVNSASWRAPLSRVIASTGGRDGGNRVQTAFGAPEYSIDNVSIVGLIAPSPQVGSGPAVKVDFEVFEPYSMGLFLESCQVAAVEKGYLSYLDNAAYVLQLEFVGRYQDGSIGTLGPYSWCLRLKNVTFTVTEAGSTYKVEAFPYGQIAYSDNINQVGTDLKLEGDSSVQVLYGNEDWNLEKYLNTREAQLVKDQKKLLPNIYKIQFVDDNPYEKSPGRSFGHQPESQGGTEPVKKEREAYDESGKVIREKMSIKPKQKSLFFSQGMTVTGIINQILMNTKEARDNVTKPEKIDGEGKITWWRIHTDVKLLGFDSSLKDYQKEITYRIAPYKIHHTAYMAPTAAAQGVAAIKASCQRVYDYIYTGKNLDIVNFKIELRNMFFQAIDPNKAERTGTMANQGTSVSVPDEGAPGSRRPEGNAGVGIGGNATRAGLTTSAGNHIFEGGAGVLDVPRKIAMEFYNAYLNSLDQYKLDIEILGDPYWLPELGQTAYHGGGPSPIAGNGTMNYEGTDIFVQVNFRTPADPDAGGAANPGPGGYYFPYPGNHPFSGVFKVTKVESKWRMNLFTQVLDGVRMPGQDGGGGGDPYPTMLGNTLKDRGVNYHIPGAGQY